MKRKLSELFGRNKKAAPAGESPVLPESANFPAGIRVAILDVDGIQWEVIYHQPEKSYSFRHLGDVNAVGPAFTMEEDHIADAAVQKGELLHPKTLDRIKSGAWLDNFQPGTFFSALDLESPKDKHGSPTDYYVIRYVDLIKFLLASVCGITVSPEATHALEAGSRNGGVNGEGVGEQPTRSDADAASQANQSHAESARGGVAQPGMVSEALRSLPEQSSARVPAEPHRDPPRYDAPSASPDRSGPTAP